MFEVRRLEFEVGRKKATTGEHFARASEGRASVGLDVWSWALEVKRLDEKFIKPFYF